VDGPFDTTTASALAEALRLDPTLAAEPERLRRALADLAPADERGGWLLALGAAAGLPALIGQGEAAQAHARLRDLCACRADAANWTVSAWALALARDLPAGVWGPAAAADEPDSEPDGPSEDPGPPTALRVAVGPDGGLVVAAVTARGVFAVDGVQASARGRWRRVAAVRAPLARDVALEPRAGLVVWTDHDGVRARALRRDGPRLGLGDPWLLAWPPAGEQARYPVAAFGHPDGGLCVLWTSDRLDLALAEERAWGTGRGAAPIPRACGDGERLAGLDWCLETSRTGWLLCRTDRGRLLAARWDLTVNECGGWFELTPPAAPVAAAVACLHAVPFAIAATAEGQLLSVDVRAAADGWAQWHSVDRPGEVRRQPPARVLAADAPHDRPADPGWLALAGNAGVWAMPVTVDADIIECGTPVPVWTGE
jgi:hypothetical protein